MEYQYVVTDHASCRFKERFPELDFEHELSTSVPFGAQRGNSIYQISKNEAVFVIEENYSIVTVLTKQQALANISVFSPNINFSMPVVSLKIKSSIEQFDEDNYAHEKCWLSSKIMKQVAKKQAKEAVANSRTTPDFALCHEDIKEKLDKAGFSFGELKKKFFTKELRAAFERELNSLASNAALDADNRIAREIMYEIGSRRSKEDIAAGYTEPRFAEYQLEAQKELEAVGLTFGGGRKTYLNSVVRTAFFGPFNK